MNCSSPIPRVCLARSGPGVLDPGLVNEPVCSVWIAGPCQPRSSIEEFARVASRLARGRGRGCRFTPLVGRHSAVVSTRWSFALRFVHGVGCLQVVLNQSNFAVNGLAPPPRSVSSLPPRADAEDSSFAEGSARRRGTWCSRSKVLRLGADLASICPLGSMKAQLETRL